MNTARLSRRYPGVTPFEREQEHLFFGRDQEIADLLRLTALERLLVLFGKSGHGKSSLLNAGVLPKLPAAFRGKTCVPIAIRLGAYARGESLPPKDALLAELERACPPAPGTAFYDNLPTGRTLWREFKRRQPAGGTPVAFVLLFDQFEEFFLYPADQQQQFRQEISELLYTEIPQAAFHEFDRLDEAAQDQLSQPLDVHAVFAIRSDRLHLLDSMRQELPDILRKRYELRGLRAEQAEAAMVRPAAADDPRFDTLPFAFQPAALQRIVDELASGSAGEEAGQIESFQLQIVCQSIEDAVRTRNRRGEKAVTIAAADLPDFEKIFENYYAARIGSLADAEQERTARLLLEEELLYVDEAKGEARRLSMDGDALAANLHAKHGRALPPALLDALVNAFLVRREQTARGTHYEISHDTLMGAILAAREERRRAEREAAERERARAEAEAQRREREKIRRARNRSLAIGLGALLLLGWALWSARDAAEKNRLAEAKTLDAQRADSAARAAIDTAAVKTRYAELKEKEATAALTAAEAAELKALQEQAKANAAKAEVVGSLLEKARNDVYRLEYENARASLLKAAALGQRKTEVAQALYEIAFVDYHTGQTARAASMAEVMQQLAGLEKQKITASFSKDTPGGDDRVARLADNMHTRYFGTMIPIEGGSFDLKEYNRKDTTIFAYRATVSSFRIAATETTWWQYYLFCQASGYEMPEKPVWGSEGDNPVVNVSWCDAVVFANWRSEQAGLQPVYIIDSTGKEDCIVTPATAKGWANGFRLPTGAEWQYAATNRGRDDYRYAGSDSLELVGWYYKNSGSRSRPVQRLQANAPGLYDMSGNAWEWCWDWYGAYKDTGNPQINPAGPEEGSYRVIRGGSWGNYPQSCRVAYRYYDAPGYRDYSTGFRLARTK
ncbi:MAG: SUMF1/EgtB/PvdO family nonheme iron enzyme [Saprospirales bacterium]|nr:SUMF1/EgtB/PvdO family nonheme iron enzyme [Saprospirales bacterium]